MKKNYSKPCVSVVALNLQQMIAVSQVTGTMAFSEEITDETTDDALSRRRNSLWGGEEEEDEL